MSYNKFMFHRLAEEAERIAYDITDDSGEGVAEIDVATMLNAIGLLMFQCGYGNELENAAVEFAAASMSGDMDTVFNELPEVLNNLENVLLDKRGYTKLENDDVTIWYKEEQ